MERRRRQEVVTPEVPIPLEVDNRYVYRFDKALEWANNIRFIRKKFAVLQDGPHLDIICRYDEAGNYIVLHFKMQDMALPVQNINHSAFRSMFEKEKLSGNNFNDWFARLKLVLRVKKKMHVIEQPLPPAPKPVAEPQIVAEWTALYDAHTEIACLMLGTGVEKFDLIQSFHACKQEEGKPVADYVLKMKGYVKKLERLGYELPQDITVGLILNGLVICLDNCHYAPTITRGVVSVSR
ncbi:hypothetical protein Tco_0984724 [Tanacetum coccineum]